jgi:hypothetical protein
VRLREAPVRGRRRRLRAVPPRPPARSRRRAERGVLAPSSPAAGAGVPEVGVAVRVAPQVRRLSAAGAPAGPPLLPDAAGGARLRRRRGVQGRRHRVPEAAQRQVLRPRRALRPQIGEGEVRCQEALVLARRSHAALRREEEGTRTAIPAAVLVQRGQRHRALAGEVRLRRRRAERLPGGVAVSVAE